MPPEPNPDGSYTFSAEEIKNILSYFEALKQEEITQASRLHYIEEAKACFPTKQQQDIDADRFTAVEQARIKEHEASKKPPLFDPNIPLTGLLDFITGTVKPLVPQQQEQKSTELLAIEKALQERHDKERDNLKRSHWTETNQKTGKTPDQVNDMLDRHTAESDRLTKRQETEMKRYIQEHKEAQKLVKEMEERSAQERLKPHAPRP